MNVLEKAEKSLEYLKNYEGSAKSHELQAAAGTLGRCLGALGSRSNCARHYANLLQSAVPILLSLASDDSAEIRLLGDEALNRIIVGGFAFHSHKTNVILQNQIDSTKNARWVRAALNRICLGDNWLRPGPGKIRSQAQTLFPKLSQIVKQSSEVQVVMEALENNLPRLMNALAEYTTDEEILELLQAISTHAERTESSMRRAASSCIATLLSHREVLLIDVLDKVFEKLWPITTDSATVLGWFSILKAIFQTVETTKLTENDVLGSQDYLELYYLCLHYIEYSTVEHNIQNGVMECLTVLLSHASGACRKALLDSHPGVVNLNDRTPRAGKGHKREHGASRLPADALRSVSPASSTGGNVLSEREELTLSGALRLGGSLPRLHTPSLSREDLAIETPGPDSPESDAEIELPREEDLTRDLSEKLQEIEEAQSKETDYVDHPRVEAGFQINIGASSDDDIPLKYCARLLASKFLLAGNKGDLISDRSIRVSVKAVTLNCLSEILKLYPQAMTMYVDKDAESKSHNVSGSTDTDGTQDQLDFILERNVCYQDSLTDSLSQELLNRSTDSHPMSKKDSKSTDKSTEKSIERSIEKSQESTDQKSSLKDVQSHILDCKSKDLAGSGMTDSTNPNMTNSNFMTNSNMTDNTTGYPLSSSGDVLSSSLDLDMKFDHFGESTTNLDNLKDLDVKGKKRLKRTDEVQSKDAPDGLEFEKSVKSEEGMNKMDCSKDSKDLSKDSKDFEFQHMSDVFILLEGHSDPLIRGLVRVCIGCYLSSSLELSHGDYHRWKNYNNLPKEVRDNFSTEKLIDILLKGLTDEVHTTVNYTLTVLTSLSGPLCNSAHWSLLDVNTLTDVQYNTYWLCRVNLCKAIEKLPFGKLFILHTGFYTLSKRVMDTLYRLLGDEDQKVRNAAAQALANIIPTVNPSKRHTPTTMVTNLAKEETSIFTFKDKKISLELVRDIYFYHDLPDMLKSGEVMSNTGSLKVVVGDLMGKIMSASCKYYWQGLLEALRAITNLWSPWQHMDAFSHQGILQYCVECLDYCDGPVSMKTVLLDLCTRVYPVEIHEIMKSKTNRDVFERDAQSVKERWQHLDSERVANLSEKFLQVTLKMLNVLVHLIEEVNPNVHLNKTGIALPGSPVRRKSNDPQRKGNATEATDDKATLRKKATISSTGLKGNLAGHFYNEPLYMKFYESLRSTYSNHKINLDQKSSMFHDFLSSILNCLAIQLELATEKEFGNYTEEILYYLRVIMPLCSDQTVYCVTQLLKCLFGTNMINQYQDFLSISDRTLPEEQARFYEDIMLVNEIVSPVEDSRKSSVTSISSQKVVEKNPKLAADRDLLLAMENFSKNRTDKKWSTNKKELERYIRLFEPVVIQALKSYTMQNDIPLQCKVLGLLVQLLTLRVNYCMLDSDQVFIGFLLRQLELVEQHEIPNCCDLVNSIMMFLVQLSSSKHHTKQIIEVPKLIQLCDGLMASGAHAECIAGLEPVVVKVFSSMGGGSVLGRAQQQEAQATREVVFYMLQKTMHQPKVLDLVSCVLSLSHSHAESYYRWSELACDSLLNLVSGRLSIELDKMAAVQSLERLVDCVHKDVLLEQSRVQALVKMMLKAPPDQASTPFKEKLRYLTIIMTLLRKVLILIPESEILLTINYLKSSHISPQSIFFNVKTDVDPLHVQNINENCANLSPDVILVRFLFKTLTLAICELGYCNDGSIDLSKEGDSAENHKLLYAVCVGIIVQVKHMLHLTDGCLFPLTAKTAQTILHNEQSGLNTGLYSPDENIPLDTLNVICLRSAHKLPMLTLHWSHLLIRLNFLTHKYWQKLVGFARNLPLHSSGKEVHKADILQAACTVAYCEYFVENGLTEVVHLTWLLVNRIQHLIQLYSCSVVRLLIRAAQGTAASGVLLQAAAARCQNCLTGEFALNTCKVLSECHESQSGALVFLICRIIGKLEPSVSVRFAKLAIDRCRLLKDMAIQQINMQLTKEDVQVALELLQRDKVHVRSILVLKDGNAYSTPLVLRMSMGGDDLTIRRLVCSFAVLYPSLVLELNALASSVFDLSPLDLSQDRAINPQYIVTTAVDGEWLKNTVKNRCCEADCTEPKVSTHDEFARIISSLPYDDLTAVLSCPKFDRKLLNSCFRFACDQYLKEFLNIVSVHEMREMERDRIREQRRMAKLKEEMTSSVDSNKLNVANTLQVFRKSESKESKSQFFIPITEDESLKESFGNLEISDDDNSSEIVLPELPDLYKVAITVLDKSLSEVIRLFPKQSRPLSQSENFNLNIEQTIDRYTRRCHQVFQDKMFYKEFITIQTMLVGFLDALSRILYTIDETDCDLLEKCIENILPTSLTKNLSVFSVISLQYISFLIKNKKIVESPIHADVSFRVTATMTDAVIVDNVIAVTLDNTAKMLEVDEVWASLNSDANVNRTQSSISCLYAVVKYLVKDTRPLILKQCLQTQDSGPQPDIIITGNKLVTLVDYWESNFYKQNGTQISKCCRRPIESLIVSLSRLELVTNIALIPPVLWPAVEVVVKKDELNRIELPFQALQDIEVLEAFLFRMNLTGWTNKKQFEELWAVCLVCLQGEMSQNAIRGLQQLLLSAASAPRMRRYVHLPRHCSQLNSQMYRLRNMLVGTSAYKMFDDVNLERVPLASDGFDGYHYAQYSTEYLKYASEIIDDASYKVRREVKRSRKYKQIDVNSCLQLLMDISVQMLDVKADAGAGSSAALVRCLACASAWLSSGAQWACLADSLLAWCARARPPAAACALLAALATCLPTVHQATPGQENSSVHQKLVKSLSSGYAPLRHAALQGCLLQLTGKSHYSGLQDLMAQLNVAVRQYLDPKARISLYEQSLYWAILFILVEMGHPDLINTAVEFLLDNPRHYCVDLVVKGITSTIQQQILPKDVKKSMMEKLLNNMASYGESHAIQIIMMHLFSADNKLLSPKLTSDVSNMDPDILMNSMERITFLYKVLRQCKTRDNMEIITIALKYFLRETLPPAAILSRVVIEFLECCKETEKRRFGVLSDRERWIECSVFNAEIVFEVFESAVSQDQLPVLSGWTFEALCHLLHGKISYNLPYCLLTLLVNATSVPHIRKLYPLCQNVLKLGFQKNVEKDESWGVFSDFVGRHENMRFKDRRLICIVALHSNFTESQLERLKELCVSYNSLDDLCQCLSV